MFAYDFGRGQWVLLIITIVILADTLGWISVSSLKQIVWSLRASLSTKEVLTCVLTYVYKYMHTQRLVCMLESTILWNCCVSCLCIRIYFEGKHILVKFHFRN